MPLYASWGPPRPKPRTPSAESASTGPLAREAQEILLVEKYALRAAIESARDQRVLHIGYPYDGSKTYQISDAAEILNRFDSKAAMLSIDKRPLESSGGECLEQFPATEFATRQRRVAACRPLAPALTSFFRIYLTATIEICSRVGKCPLASAALGPGKICCTVVRAGGAAPKVLGVHAVHLREVVASRPDKHCSQRHLRTSCRLPRVHPADCAWSAATESPP